MVHQAHKVLPEPGDYRPTSWRDVVGLLMALIGLARGHDADDVAVHIDDGSDGANKWADFVAQARGTRCVSQ
jgi:hypothetical protein